MVDAGYVALGEASDGSMQPIGCVPVVNGDAGTGIVEVPGRRLAVLQAPDGTLIGLSEDIA